MAIVATALFQLPKMGYKVLFPGMNSEESAQVFATLQGMEVQPEIDANGQVLVPKSQWDQLVFQLNGMGYPKTTLSYDTFSNASGFTSTEFEKRVALVLQAQDRMQQTLLRQEGVEDVVVTFSVPENSNYIWNQDSQQESSAGVSIRMRPGYELTPERVTAIKHLAATSVPKLKPNDVVVVDAATGIEMPGTDAAAGLGFYGVQRLEFEREIAKSIEDNIKRLLAGKYGPDGVTAVATVTLDYDKMMSESKQYQPGDNGKSGIINHFDENYSLNGEVAAEGIVGEEDNTDAPPQYPNQENGDATSATDYQRTIDYDVSYVLTQIEKGEPLLKKASVAVIVNDPDFDTEVEETLVSLISKGVSISADNIKVTNLNFSAQEVVPAVSQGQNVIFGGLTLRQMLLIGIGALLLIAAVFLGVILLSRGKKRRKEEAAQKQVEEEERQLQEEIEEHKRMLQNEAMAAAHSKETAITEEVRSFAGDNPEITAALIRSLLREER